MGRRAPLGINVLSKIERDSIENLKTKAKQEMKLQNRDLERVRLWGK